MCAHIGYTDKLTSGTLNKSILSPHQSATTWLMDNCVCGCDCDDDRTSGEEEVEEKKKTVCTHVCTVSNITYNTYYVYPSMHNVCTAYNNVMPVRGSGPLFFQRAADRTERYRDRRGLRRPGRVGGSGGVFVTWRRAVAATSPVGAGLWPCKGKPMW